MGHLEPGHFEQRHSSGSGAAGRCCSVGVEMAAGEPAKNRCGYCSAAAAAAGIDSSHYFLGRSPFPLSHNRLAAA